MSTKSARQLPDTFNWVKLRAVGRQVIKPHNISMLTQPGLEHPCVMPARVIQYDKHLAAVSLMA